MAPLTLASPARYRLGIILAVVTWAGAAVTAPQAGAEEPAAAPTKPPRASPATPSRLHAFVNPLGMKFVPVDCGGRTVLFSIWETRVRDFKAFVDDTQSPVTTPVLALTAAGWKNTTGATWDRPSHPQSPDHPVCGVTFDQAVAFCQWLSKKESRQYRLPSDHEWSCAVGIGSREDPAQSPQSKSNRIADAYPWGTDWPPPENSGNFAGEESRPGSPADWRTIGDGWRDRFPRTATVGSFPENKLGLFDLGGNVFEWCDTGFGGPGSPDRTLRGGCWATCEKLYLTSSYRVRGQRVLAVEQYGFRVALDPPPSPPTAPAEK